LPRFARNDKGEKGSERRPHPVIARLTPSAEAISDTMAAVAKQYYVYIMTNIRNTVLYVGVTNDLIRRVYEHKEKLADGFTKKYNIVKLVYYEVLEDIENAIVREKQIKAGSRRKKIQLINGMNREWSDLYDEL
jgi:putative endonuclease